MAAHREPVEVFAPCDFIAAIMQHIPDKSFQLVLYCGWYSDKMRGQRDKHAAKEQEAMRDAATELIDVSEHRPPEHRLPEPPLPDHRLDTLNWHQESGINGSFTVKVLPAPTTLSALI
jgi:hypothetical protein